MTCASPHTVHRADRYRVYPAYRVSNTRWVEETPAHWRVYSLKRFVANIVEKGRRGLLPFVALEHIQSAAGCLMRGFEWEDVEAGDYSTFRAGDVLFGKLRPYLRKCILADRDGCCPTELLVLRSDRGDCTPRFLYYMVQSQPFIATAVSTSYGVKMPRTSWEALGAMHVSLPPHDEQSAICAYLDGELGAIDLLIAKDRSLLALLSERKRAVVDRSVLGACEDATLLKPSGFEWFDALPVHWSVLPVKYLAASRGDAIKTGPFGSQLLASDMQYGTVKVYNQRNVIDGDMASGENYISEEKFEELRSFEVDPGDVLVTTRGTIGRCTIVPDDSERGILHPCLMRIKVNRDLILPEYLELLVEESSLVLTQLSVLSNATTIEVVYSDNMRQVILPVPPIDEQRRILSHLEAALARISEVTGRVERQISSLMDRRLALITAGVTGQIDVRGA